MGLFLSADLFYGIGSACRAYSAFCQTPRIFLRRSRTSAVLDSVLTGARIDTQSLRHATTIDFSAPVFSLCGSKRGHCWASYKAHKGNAHILTREKNERPKKENGP
nr:hypothetical protein [Pandoravirus massiliensis]